MAKGWAGREDLGPEGLARHSQGKAGKACLQGHVKQELTVQLEHVMLGADGQVMGHS